MGVTIPINKHIYAFRRAWKEQVYSLETNPRNFTLKESAKAWEEKLGIRMSSFRTDGTFDTAEFKSEADYIAFLLKWG